MFRQEQVKAFQDMAPWLIDFFPGGAVFLITSGVEITWRLASATFDLQDFQVGEPVRGDSAFAQAIQTGKTVSEKIPRSVYGTRINLTAAPIQDQDRIIGSLAVLIPQLHPVAYAFPSFAPILANMFSEGGFLYITDLEKIAFRQGSHKFDLPEFQVGSLLKEGGAARKALSSKKPAVEDLDSSIYGVPVRLINHPLFEEDDSGKAVGTLGLALPRQNAVHLRQMADNLNKSLEEISSVIQELAAAAAQIAENEHSLHQHIRDVFHLSEEINTALSFFNQLTDETMMFGVYAALEAARAGNAGQSFGVVAEESNKLSDEAKKTVERIYQLIGEIKTKVIETTRKCEQTLRSSEEQAAATEEVAASIQEISSLALEMEIIAKTI